MNFIPEELRFLALIILIGVARVLLSIPMSVVMAVSTFFAASFLAAIFTHPVLTQLGLEPFWEGPVAVAIGFFGAYLAKHLSYLAENPAKIKGVVKEVIEVITIWRKK
ncbi:hypothetical protein [Paenirhodobacter populi]|uniref:Uncharacterized protein n=1 Tax=Paenirhodobacter populi TaxID=2306993 RepID=A0A443J036_9RHOB|nr:hypothetical protein [Sinirhodobacter populi]RWR13814.1 hypothetical protein D2T33_05295 [Sinirhodobacter populi]